MTFSRPGISDEFLMAAGVEFVADPEPQLRIPYHDIEGKLTGHWRARLQHPRLDGQKYTQPAGTDSPVYFTHLPLVAGDILYGVEGEFKSLSAAEAGFQIIGFPGLHSYTRDLNGNPQVLPGVWEAIRKVEPKEFCLIGDADTISNLQYYRSAHTLATAFPAVRVKLIQLPLGGPKGLDDLRESLDGQFSEWMENARKEAWDTAADQSFLIAALICLEAAADKIAELPPAEREWHKGRIIRMAALARLAKGEARSAVEYFCAAAQKVSKLPKPAFQAVVDDEIAQICKETGAEVPGGSPRPKFMETVEPWPDPVEGRELFDAVRALFRRPIFASEDDYHLLALKTFESFLIESFSCLSILRIRSPEKGCGKSTVLDTLELLVQKAFLCITATVASLFRTTTQYHPSFLIDESKEFGKNNDDLRAFACAAYERGRTVPRINPNTLEVELFETFSWLTLASVEALDETIEDRAITIFLKRKPAQVETEELDDIDPQVFHDLKRKIQRWANDHAAAIKAMPLPRPQSMHNRNWKKWRSLLKIARELDEQCLIDSLSIALRKTREFAEEPSLQIEILLRIRTAFKEQGKGFLATTVLLKALNGDKEAPWADWTNGVQKGLTATRLGKVLREHFQVKSHRPGRNATTPRGYRLKDLEPFFNMLPPEDPPPPGRSGVGSSEPLPTDDPETSGSDPSVSAPSFGEPGPTRSPIVNPSESGNKLDRVQIEILETSRLNPVPLNVSESTASEMGSSGTDFFTEGDLVLPPSAPQVSFCVPTHPERSLYLDTETFYPWEGSYSQPPDKTVAQLLRKKNKGEAHPWAKDPRRCALRFLTIHDTEGTFGSEPLAIDFPANPELPANVLETLATRTLVGHNLDFDLTVLRRYGIPVSSSVIDTLTASRLLGLGKEKLKFQTDTAYCDLDCEELLEELISLEADNPVDHDLATVVRRYLGIRMEKVRTKLGGCDWSRTDLSPAHYTYMGEDVAHLPALWTVLEKELREASLGEVFRERMRFFPHLNQIKMTGIPIDSALRDADHETVFADKKAIREELRTMFADYRHPIPKSRLKTIRIQIEGGKFQRIPGPTEEEFAPSNRDHVLGALTHRGIYVENTQEATLRKIDQPECRLLLKYATAKNRLEAIKGIARSTFPDNRVRAAGWNQLSARTGRMTSTEPNLQQVPRNWRNGFRVDPPKLWLKGDLSQIEMVLIAVVTGDHNLTELLWSGRDVYVEYGSRIFGKKAERGPGDDQITERLRDVAKVPTLGISYGLTPFGFVRRIRDELGMEFDIQQAQVFFETFFEMFPQIAVYHDRAAEDALNLGSVRTIAGTRRWLPPLMDDRDGDYWPSFERRKKILVNTPIQGSGADLVIWAVNQFMPQLSQKVEIANIIHDEVSAIVTEETLQPTVEIITRAFQETFARFYPSSSLKPKIKFSVGPSWGETVSIDGTGA
jgi:DNA polymerase I-like protein with 3'-5' exonuclease and polymerase domains